MNCCSKSARNGQQISIFLIFARATLKPMAIFVTYDNQALQDGLGAQALRITGIYSIARAFGLNYFHTPIARVIEDVGQNPTTDKSQENLLEFFNNFFEFTTSRNPRSQPRNLYVRDISLRKLLKIILMYRFSARDTVVHILLPQGILDKFPSIYRLAARQLRASSTDLINSSNAKCLVAHVRRGYDEKYADLKYAKNRHLPFSYFSDILKYICTNNLVPAGSEIHIHTDLLNVPTKWTPKQDGIVEGYRKNSGTTGKTSIDLEAYDLTKEIDIPQGFPPQIHYCDPLITTFLDMCNAKVLVQGKSALSYLAGIVNTGLVIHPPQQSMSKLPRWKSAEDLNITLRDPLLG